MRNIDPDSEENQRQTRDNARYIGGLQLEAIAQIDEAQDGWREQQDRQEQDAEEQSYAAKVACPHDNLDRLPGVTSTNVKISVCRDCGEQIEEDQK